MEHFWRNSCAVKIILHIINKILYYLLTVAPEPTISNRNVSTTLAVPATTLAPRDSSTVAKAATSQKTTSHNGPLDEGTTTEDLFDEPDVIHVSYQFSEFFCQFI